LFQVARLSGDGGGMGWFEMCWVRFCLTIGCCFHLEG
jgi:hypothetical protein